MALTPEGTPYVESTDLVANYPAASLSLANRVDVVGVLPFADSAARATAIPSPTDGQYSYLQDTNSTEFWNGSAWVVAGKTPGLNLVAATSINNTGGTVTASGGQVTLSAVESVSLNGVFSSLYDNYRILLIGVGSANGMAMAFRLRVGGVDNSANNYTTQNIRATTTTPASSNQTATSISPMPAANTTQMFLQTEVFRPFLAIATQFSSTTGRTDYIQNEVGIHTVASSFDGFTISTPSNNFTGVLRVYGYQNT
jgi:hypothetical protein